MLCMALDPDALPLEVEAFAAERHLATLTTLRPDATPHVVPVGFTWDGDARLVRIITFASSRKVRNLRASPGGRAVVCQVDGGRWLAFEGPATVTVRSVFVVGPDNKVKLTLTYPQSTGRNFDELLRVIDSLQLTAKYKVSTPSDWRQGEDVIIIPAVSDDEAKERFPEGWETRKPYLRLVKQPQG